MPETHRTIYWEVPTELQETFAAWCRRHGTTMSFVGTNMLRDFMATDEAIQLARAGLTPNREDFIRLQIAVLEKMLAKKKPRRRPAQG